MVLLGTWVWLAGGAPHRPPRPSFNLLLNLMSLMSAIADPFAPTVVRLPARSIAAQGAQPMPLPPTFAAARSQALHLPPTT